MKARRVSLLVPIIILALLMLPVALGLMQHFEQPAIAMAAPPAVPTPVGAQAGSGYYTMVPYFAATIITYTQASTSRLTPSYIAADIHSVLDVSSTQTITCKIQWSNDDTNWADGVNLFTAQDADYSEITQTQMFGQRSRVTCTVSSANPVTVTIRAKAFR